MCSHLLGEFRGVEQFSLEEHISVPKTVIVGLKTRKTALNDFALESILESLDCDTCRTIKQGTETGQWFSVMPSTLNGTELSAKDFWDALLLNYAWSPGDLLPLCDGCGAATSMHHALPCKTGGLVIL